MDKAEKVFFSNKQYRVSNHTITVWKERLWDWSEFKAQHLFNSQDVEQVEEITTENFEIKRLFFVMISILFVLLFSPSSLQSGSYSIIESYFAWLMATTGFNVGISHAITYASYTLLAFATYENMIKSDRYLSIKTKDGLEFKMNSPWSSLSVVSNAWGKAKCFGLVKTTQTESDDFKSYSVEVRGGVFSLLDLKHTSFTDQNFGFDKWKSYLVKDIKAIQDGEVNDAWLSSSGILALISAGFLTSVMLMNSSGEVTMLEASLYSVIMASIMLFIKKLSSRTEQRMRVVMNDGEVIDLNGDYDFNGKSALKTSLSM